VSGGWCVIGSHAAFYREEEKEVREEGGREGGREREEFRSGVTGLLAERLYTVCDTESVNRCMGEGKRKGKEKRGREGGREGGRKYQEGKRMKKA